MANDITIALDAMGGDDAPDIVIAGAALARARHPNVKFLLFGDEGRIAPLLARHAELKSAVQVHHTDSVVQSTDRPSIALRKGRQSSMRLAINAVGDGSAGGVVSAGNTGALMAMSKFVLKMLPGIDRPAICTIMPTERGKSVVLDLGANVDCDADNLVQFAVMGAAFARTDLGLARPTVGLLNIGEEEIKGNDNVKNAARILKDANLPFEYYGFIEGDDIAKGTTDVVVTDGFTGNVALKVAEGTAHLFRHFLRKAFTSSNAAKLGYAFARKAMNSIRDDLDPRNYNGAALIGLNGISIKSHGSTDAVGFAAAIDVAVELIEDDVTGKIIQDFDRFGGIAVDDVEVAAS